MPRKTISVPARLERLKEAAPYARCTVKTLRNRIADGTLTAYRSGPKLILVDLDEIDAKLIRRVATAGQ
jgi:excisionase family DNA binding protein